MTGAPLSELHLHDLKGRFDADAIEELSRRLAQHTDAKVSRELEGNFRAAAIAFICHDAHSGAQIPTLGSPHGLLTKPQESTGEGAVEGIGNVTKDLLFDVATMLDGVSRGISFVVHMSGDQPLLYSPGDKRGLQASVYVDPALLQTYPDLRLLYHALAQDVIVGIGFLNDPVPVSRVPTYQLKFGKPASEYSRERKCVFPLPTDDNGEHGKEQASSSASQKPKLSIPVYSSLAMIHSGSLVRDRVVRMAVDESLEKKFEAKRVEYEAKIKALKLLLDETDEQLKAAHLETTRLAIMLTEQRDLANDLAADIEQRLVIGNTSNQPEDRSRSHSPLEGECGAVESPSPPRLREQRQIAAASPTAQADVADHLFELPNQIFGPKVDEEITRWELGEHRDEIHDFCFFVQYERSPSTWKACLTNSPLIGVHAPSFVSAMESDIQNRPIHPHRG